MPQKEEFAASRSVDSKLGPEYSDTLNGPMGTKLGSLILVLSRYHPSVLCCTSVKECGADMAKVLQD